jgi:digeranylgeranylglycerophospholipid reductase
MRESFHEAVVVGGGPAGSMTAMTLAERGVETLQIERNMEIGVPVKCGEFIPALEEMQQLAPDVDKLENLFDPPKHCIVNRTRYVNFLFPNGEKITIPFKGVVVERKLYDKHLANQAARAGAEISPFTKALDILEGENGVKARDIKCRYDIHAKAIIGADGPYSLIARKAGLPISNDPLDYAIGYQYEMVNVEHDPEYVDMYLGKDIAPGTYAWIIPKGEDIANVGTGARTPFMKKGLSIRDYQNNFIKKHPIASEKLKKAVPTAIKAGYIPVGGPIKETSTPNTLVVGDAAGHTIPTVGGGIPPALICGRIAGEVTASHLQEDKPLTDFDKVWRKQLGKTLDNSLRIRRMSDIVFRNEKLIDFITKKGWLTEEMIKKFVLCEMDTKMRLVEKALQMLQPI